MAKLVKNGLIIRFSLIEILIVAYPNNFKIICCANICQNFGLVINMNYVNRNQIVRPVDNGYFCHITIMKWSQNSSKIKTNINVL